MSIIKLAAIVAMSENRIIGRDNQLIWHLPEDLKHFKKTTMGKPLIMGRKSFESLPGVLPGRPHVVVSRSKPSSQMLINDNIRNVTSLEDAIATAQDLALKAGEDEVFIAGGGEVYRQTLPQVQRLYLTIVHQDYEGDTEFPKLQWEEWSVEDVQEFDENPEKDLPSFTIMRLERIR